MLLIDMELDRLMDEVYAYLQENPERHMFRMVRPWVRTFYEGTYFAAVFTYPTTTN